MCFIIYLFCQQAQHYFMLSFLALLYYKLEWNCQTVSQFTMCGFRSHKSVKVSESHDCNTESLFAPLQTLELSPAPLYLSLPDLPYANSLSPPVSLTPLSVQDTNMGPFSNIPRVHTMLVDGNAPSVLMALTAPSTLIAPTVLNTPVTLLQDINAPLCFNDDKLDTTPISSHLAGSMEYQTGLQAGNPLLNLIDKFIKGIFPLVYDAHPATPFINIDKVTIAAWDSFPTFKLIAIPLASSWGSTKNMAILLGAFYWQW